MNTSLTCLSSIFVFLYLYFQFPNFHSLTWFCALLSLTVCCSQLDCLWQFVDCCCALSSLRFQFQIFEATIWEHYIKHALIVFCLNQNQNPILWHSCINKQATQHIPHTPTHTQYLSAFLAFPAGIAMPQTKKNIYIYMLHVCQTKKKNRKKKIHFSFRKKSAEQQ